GMAVVYAEGADHAYLVRMENYKRNLKSLGDEQLKRISRAYASVMPYQMIPNIGSYDLPHSANGELDPTFYQAAGRLLSDERNRRIWARILFCLVLRPVNVMSMLHLCSEHIEEEMPHLSAEQHDALLRMLIVRGAAEVMHERGARFGWSYGQVEQLREMLTRGLLGLVHVEQLRRQGGESTRSVVMTELEKTRDLLLKFMNTYTSFMERRQGPFPGCVHCPVKCFYRAEVSSLMMHKDYQWINDELSSTAHRGSEERYTAVSQAATQIAQTWLGEELGSKPGFGVPSIGYCAVLHTVSHARMTEYEQGMVGNYLKPHLLDN
ncbi:MAG: hypothetical protein J2P36_39340, partial [Ktedonobacteraceae bacterium]|nr:hypothetical protein [Ktedonobacteraceae bacterium]